MASSAFQTAARWRYRFASIHGDGKFGVVRACVMSKVVVLYPTPQQADRALHVCCGAMNCTGKHHREDFEAVIPPSAQVPGQFQDWPD